ncbi:MAG: hypothetical protein ACPGYT_03075 [Nitrospirales bacterium]
MMSYSTCIKCPGRISKMLIGAFLVVIVPAILTAHAGLDVSTDRNSQCAWVKPATSPTQTSVATLLHSEPEEGLLVDEDVNIITGLYTRSYSRQQNGTIDYKTARQIVISEYNEYWNTVVHTKEFPLLYWEDDNHDGEFEMWIDQQGDGAPCDIVPYHIQDESPGSRSIGF